MNLTRIVLGASFVSILVFACSDSSSTSGGSTPDGGSSTDADSGVTTMGVDSGNTQEGTDAGTDNDSGTDSDSGAQDSGTETDSGVDSGVDAGPATWTTVYTTIIGTHCGNSCHSAGAKSGGLDMGSQATAYTNLVGVASGEAAGTKYINAGHPETSYLYLKISEATPPVGVQMPKGGTPLTSAQQATVSSWITAGANNN